MDEPRKELLDRATPRDFSEHLDRAASLLERATNYGTHLIVRCDQAAKDRDWPIAPVMIGRHVIEVVDAISVLLRRRCVDPAKILLRSQLDAVMFLQYIAEKDSAQRSLQYFVGHIHARIEDHLKGDPTTELGQRFWAEMAKDEMFGDIPRRPYDSKKHVENLERMLAKPIYAPIEAEWQRMRAVQKEQRKTGAGPIIGQIFWYSLFDGPKNIQNLARHLKSSGNYEVLYRMYSAYTHGQHALRSLQPTKSGAMAYQPIRYPIDLRDVTAFAMSLTLMTYRLLHQVLLVNDLAEYAKWYVHQIRPEFNRIMKLEITDPDHPKRD